MIACELIYFTKLSILEAVNLRICEKMCEEFCMLSSSYVRNDVGE